MKHLLLLGLALCVLSISASAQGTTVQTDDSIKAKATVTIDMAAVNGQVTPVYGTTTRRVAVSKKPVKPNPNVRYVTRTQSAVTGYKVSLPASQATATVDVSIDKQQIVNVVDSRISDTNVAVNTLAGRVNDLEVDMDAVNGRVDRTNDAVNRLAGRVNNQDERLTVVENRKDKKDGWMAKTALALSIYSTVASTYNLFKGNGNNNGRYRNQPCYGRNCGGGNPNPCGYTRNCNPCPPGRVCNNGGPVRVCNGLPCTPGYGNRVGPSTNEPNYGAGWNPVQVNGYSNSYTNGYGGGYTYRTSSGSYSTGGYTSGYNTGGYTYNGGGYTGSGGGTPVRVH